MLNNIDRRAAQEALSASDTRATVLHSIALAVFQDKLYGDEDSPDPLEVFAELEDQFGSALSDENQNRLQAIMTAVQTDAFFEDEIAFIAIVETLLDGDLGELPQGRVEDVSMLEVLWAFYEVNANREDEREFAPEVQRAIDRIIAHEAYEADTELNVADYPVIFIAALREQLVEQLAAVWGNREQIEQGLPTAEVVSAVV